MVTELERPRNISASQATALGTRYLTKPDSLHSIFPLDINHLKNVICAKYRPNLTKLSIPVQWPSFLLTMSLEAPWLQLCAPCFPAFSDRF